MAFSRRRRLARHAILPITISLQMVCFESPDCSTTELPPPASTRVLPIADIAERFVIFSFVFDQSFWTLEFSFRAARGIGDSQDKVDNNGSQQRNSQDGGAKAIVEATLAPHADTLCAPVEGEEGVDHRGHCDEGEEAGRDLANLVAKVEQADGQTAEDDGEVQPAEECALVGEEDFGLDSGR